MPSEEEAEEDAEEAEEAGPSLVVFEASIVMVSIVMVSGVVVIV